MSGNGSASVHFHNPSFGIRNINGGTGTIEGGTFAGLSISKKRNQGDGQKDLSDLRDPAGSSGNTSKKKLRYEKDADEEELERFATV